MLLSKRRLRQIIREEYEKSRLLRKEKLRESVIPGRYPKDLDLYTDTELERLISWCKTMLKERRKQARRR